MILTGKNLFSCTFKPEIHSLRCCAGVRTLHSSQPNVKHWTAKVFLNITLIPRLKANSQGSNGKSHTKPYFVVRTTGIKSSFSRNSECSVNYDWKLAICFHPTSLSSTSFSITFTTDRIVQYSSSNQECRFLRQLPQPFTLIAHNINSDHPLFHQKVNLYKTIKCGVHLFSVFNNILVSLSLILKRKIVC